MDKLIAGALFTGLCILAVSMSGGIRPLVADLFSITEESGEAFDFSRAPTSGKTVPSAARKTEGPGRCAIAKGAAPSRGSVFINEVAWMGSGGDARREWIELKNGSARAADISRWEIRDKSGMIAIAIPQGTILPSGSLLVLARGDDAFPDVPSAIRFSGTINDADEILTLSDVACELQDEVTASARWPAGDKKTGKTAERSADFGWYTSAVSGGTPGVENTPPAEKKTAVAATGTSSVSATSFRIYISEVLPGIAGDADFEFVELYNDSDASVPLDGWSMKKRSSTGNESSFIAKNRFAGKIIGAHTHLLIGNEKGYNGTPAADMIWPGSYTLAQSKNALVLLDADGVRIDECAWEDVPQGSSVERISADASVSVLRPDPSPEGVSGAR